MLVLFTREGKGRMHSSNVGQRESQKEKERERGRGEKEGIKYNAGHFAAERGWAVTVR